MDIQTRHGRRLSRFRRLGPKLSSSTSRGPDLANLTGQDVRPPEVLLRYSHAPKETSIPIKWWFFTVFAARQGIARRTISPGTCLEAQSSPTARNDHALPLIHPSADGDGLEKNWFSQEQTTPAKELTLPSSFHAHSPCIACDDFRLQ